MPTSHELLDRLESRHDELIRKLDELNVAIEATLAQFTKVRSEAVQPLDATAAEVAADIDRRAA